MSVIWCGIPDVHSEIAYCFWVNNGHGCWHLWERTYDVAEAERIFDEYLSIMHDDKWFMDAYRARA
jgi:hypothetical protein